MMKTVLVPVDGSPAAETVFPYLELIASRTGAALHLVSALERGDEDPALGETITYLEGMADRLRSQSLSCSREVSSGEAADAILSQADAKDVDLIAMTTHGRTGLRRWVLGSVAQKVLHGTARPLLLVRAQEPQERPEARIDRIVVPLDGSEISTRILPFAEELANALDASLVLYHGVPPLELYAGARPLDPGAGVAATSRAATMTGVLIDESQLFLRELADEIEARGKVKAEALATIGHPIEEIVRVAEAAKAGLIAMATHGHSGVQRWVMGSVAEGVVRRSPLPCLLLRPDQAGEPDR